MGQGHPAWPAYGEVWCKENTDETVIGGAGTFVQFAGFANNGESNECTPDQANDHIEIDQGGRYKISAAFHVESVGGGAADVIAIEIRKNNGATAFSNLHAHRKLAGGGGDIASIGISGIIDLDAGDTLEVWLANDDNATNLLVEDANLSVVQVGPD